VAPVRTSHRSGSRIRFRPVELVPRRPVFDYVRDLGLSRCTRTRRVANVNRARRTTMYLGITRDPKARRLPIFGHNWVRRAHWQNSWPPSVTAATSNPHPCLFFFPAPHRMVGQFLRPPRVDGFFLLYLFVSRTSTASGPLNEMETGKPSMPC
jgi:hypothetical protein